MTARRPPRPAVPRAAYDRRVDPAAARRRLPLVAPVLLGGAVLTGLLAVAPAGAESSLLRPTADISSHTPSPTPIVPVPTTSQPAPSPSRSSTVAPTPSRSVTASASATPTRTPTARATSTRTRSSAPRTEEPVERERPTDPLPTVTGGFGVGSVAPGQVTVAPSASRTPAATSAVRAERDGERLTVLVWVVVGAGVLLGVGGGLGLYLTRSPAGPLPAVAAPTATPAAPPAPEEGE